MKRLAIFAVVALMIHFLTGCARFDPPLKEGECAGQSVSTGSWIVFSCDTDPWGGN